MSVIPFHPLFPSWIAVDGTLEEIDFKGGTNIRFPLELAQIVIERFTVKGQFVCDPFSGFGTSLRAAQMLDRPFWGFERAIKRHAFATQFIHKSTTQLINDSALNVDQYNLPKVDLLFTSPPYQSFRAFSDNGVSHYFSDLKIIFQKLADYVQPTGWIVLEVSNIRRAHQTQTLAWEIVHHLDFLEFKGEIIRCNTGSTTAGPGYNHSYLLCFQLK